MITTRSLDWLLCFALLAAGLTPSPAAQPPERPALRPLMQVLQQAVADGRVVGAQIAVGDRTGLLMSRSFGRTAPGKAGARADDDTLFCIGSCSKPVASACILALVDQKTLALDAGVGKWLPEFRRLEVKGGETTRRGPTIRELLAHRGGIYSQKNKLAREQVRAIRNYSLTLEESVAIIARQKLLWQPGSDYAYSGAGYCVLGRAAEVASGKTFETLFQETLARPLGLERTTFFPDKAEKNIAQGGRPRKGGAEDESLPHLLGAEHRLPLIGGGLYSTAKETAVFAHMILNEGRARGKQVLSPSAWQALARRQYANQDYGLGWGLHFGPAKKRVGSLDHGGALGSARSVIHVDLADGLFMVAHWTLADPSSEADKKVGEKLNQAWRTAVGRMRK
jgi:CubicO group peptidase (beta-lactamase class C family)